MNPQEFSRIAGRLMRHPAVPFHEHDVRAEVEQICKEERLKFKRDRYGNVLVRLRTGGSNRPFALAAHLDHPGFEIVRSIGPLRWRARFLGGVPKNYFRKGVPLRLMPGGESATLGRRIGKDETFEIVSDETPQAAPQFAVWELEDFSTRQDRIHGRACDDLVGVAAILATIIELKRSRARVNVIGIISRAEEIGFLGALAVAAEPGIPRNSLVVSLETSRELPGVRMGNGVILRVGDRASVFDSAGTRFLGEVGNELKRRRKDFQFQRALMSGGTCEATAYQEFGFQTVAVCVALGNYHNCGEQNRIQSEFVSLVDACSMVELLATAAKAMPRYSSLIAKLPQRLKDLLKSKNRLTASA